ncbi:MAG: hypothetical protein ACRC2H_01100 [Silanimonas sp.]
MIDIFETVKFWSALDLAGAKAPISHAGVSRAVGLYLGYRFEVRQVGWAGERKVFVVMSTGELRRVLVTDVYKLHKIENFEKRGFIIKPVIPAKTQLQHWKEQGRVS